MKGTLYVVATPIGNLEDITLRALRTLGEVDYIAVEDTRHSIKLLNRYEISKPLISYFREKEKVRAQEILGKLNAGFDVALITDAGTPGISDPGDILIREAVLAGITVSPIPGPSALSTALSVAGMPTTGAIFVGFISPKGTRRLKELGDLRGQERTLVFYESPHRLFEFLEDLLEVMGDRKIALCHELTKMHEEVIRGSVSEVLELLSERKIAGEYVVVVAGATGGACTYEEAVREVLRLMEGGMSRKDATAEVAQASGLSKKVLYKESMNNSADEAAAGMDDPADEAAESMNNPADEAPDTALDAAADAVDADADKVAADADDEADDDKVADEVADEADDDAATAADEVK
jgi:16S rRNA (cytidine1402-2'-O)-methyltransferase